MAADWYACSCHAGLTSRPAQRNGGASRYSLAAQADLILQLCEACGVTKVLLAGHSDGALLALMAAAAASRYSYMPQDSSGSVVLVLPAYICPPALSKARHMLSVADRGHGHTPAAT